MMHNHLRNNLMTLSRYYYMGLLIITIGLLMNYLGTLPIYAQTAAEVKLKKTQIIESNKTTRSRQIQKFHKKIGDVINSYVTGEVILALEDDVDMDTIVTRLTTEGYSVIQRLKILRTLMIELPNGMVVSDSVLQMFKNRSYIKASSNNFIVKTFNYRDFVSPNDSKYDKQWGLHNTGSSQLSGIESIVDADIDAPEAWTITQGEPHVAVFVLDTGIDPNHPDLKNQILEMYTYDFYNNDEDVRDLSGHGTHVAGIIAAEANNGIGIAGVSAGVSLIPIQIGNKYGNVRFNAVMEAVSYIIDMQNALCYDYDHFYDCQEITHIVLNMSFGIPYRIPDKTSEDPIYNESRKEMYERVMTSLKDANIMVVAAVGNDANSAKSVALPAYLAPDYDNLISVAALNQKNKLAAYSTTDIEEVTSNATPKVTLSAPGGYYEYGEGAILSTTPTYPFTAQTCAEYDATDDPPCYGTTNIANNYGYMSGTSQAAPHVAGIVALMWSINPSLTPHNIKTILTNTADEVDGLSNDVVAGSGNLHYYYGAGRVNAYKAIRQAIEMDPYSVWNSSFDPFISNYTHYYYYYHNFIPTEINSHFTYDSTITSALTYQTAIHIVDDIDNSLSFVTLEPSKAADLYINVGNWPNDAEEEENPFYNSSHYFYLENIADRGGIRVHNGGYFNITTFYGDSNHSIVFNSGSALKVNRGGYVKIGDFFNNVRFENKGNIVIEDGGIIKITGQSHLKNERYLTLLSGAKMIVDNSMLDITEGVLTCETGAIIEAPNSVICGNLNSCKITNTTPHTSILDTCPMELSPPPAIMGCTDSKATNYNSQATVNDGSCIYPSDTTYITQNTTWRDTIISTSSVTHVYIDSSITFTLNGHLKATNVNFHFSPDAKLVVSEQGRLTTDHVEFKRTNNDALAKVIIRGHNNTLNHTTFQDGIALKLYGHRTDILNSTFWGESARQIGRHGKFRGNIFHSDVIMAPSDHQYGITTYTTSASGDTIGSVITDVVGNTSIVVDNIFKRSYTQTTGGVGYDSNTFHGVVNFDGNSQFLFPITSVNRMSSNTFMDIVTINQNSRDNTLSNNTFKKYLKVYGSNNEFDNNTFERNVRVAGKSHNNTFESNTFNTNAGKTYIHGYGNDFNANVFKREANIYGNDNTFIKDIFHQSLTINNVSGIMFQSVDFKKRLYMTDARMQITGVFKYSVPLGYPYLKFIYEPSMLRSGVEVSGNSKLYLRHTEVHPGVDNDIQVNNSSRVYAGEISSTNPSGIHGGAFNTFYYFGNNKIITNNTLQDHNITINAHRNYWVAVSSLGQSNFSGKVDARYCLTKRPSLQTCDDDCKRSFHPPILIDDSNVEHCPELKFPKPPAPPDPCANVQSNFYSCKYGDSAVDCACLGVSSKYALSCFYGDFVANGNSCSGIYYKMVAKGSDVESQSSNQVSEDTIDTQLDLVWYKNIMVDALNLSYFGADDKRASYWLHRGLDALLSINDTTRLLFSAEEDAFRAIIQHYLSYSGEGMCDMYKRDGRIAEPICQAWYEGAVLMSIDYLLGDNNYHEAYQIINTHALRIKNLDNQVSLLHYVAKMQEDSDQIAGAIETLSMVTTIEPSSNRVGVYEPLDYSTLLLSLEEKQSENFESAKTSAVTMPTAAAIRGNYGEYMRSLLNMQELSKNDAGVLPSRFEIENNYPNPFNPTTIVNISLPIEVEVHLEIYNILGQRVSSLMKGTYAAGYYNMPFDASKLSSGIYFVYGTLGHQIVRHKMTLVK